MLKITFFFPTIIRLKHFNAKSTRIVLPAYPDYGEKLQTLKNKFTNPGVKSLVSLVGNAAPACRY